MKFFVKTICNRSIFQININKDMFSWKNLKKCICKKFGQLDWPCTVLYFTAVDHTVYHLDFVVTTKIALVRFPSFYLHFLLIFGPLKWVYCTVFNRMGLVENLKWVYVWVCIPWFGCLVLKKETTNKSITSPLTWARKEAHTCCPNPLLYPLIWYLISMLSI